MANKPKKMTDPYKQNGESQDYNKSYIVDHESLRILHNDFSNPGDLYKKIVLNLKQAIKGNDVAISNLAKTMFEHYFAVLKNQESTQRKLLLVGQDSIGKKYSAFQAASILKLPVGIVSCAMLDSVDAVTRHLEDAINDMIMDAKAKYVNFWLGRDKTKYRDAQQAVYRDQVFTPEDPKILPHNFGLTIINALYHAHLSKNTGVRPSSKEIGNMKKYIATVEDKCIEQAKKHGVIILDEIDKIIPKSDAQSAYRNEAVQDALKNFLEKENNKLRFNLHNNLIIMTCGNNTELLDNTTPILYNPLSRKDLDEITNLQITNISKLLNNKKAFPEFGRASSVYFSIDCIKLLKKVVAKCNEGARASEKLINSIPQLLKQNIQPNSLNEGEKLKITPEMIGGLLVNQSAEEDE